MLYKAPKEFAPMEANLDNLDYLHQLLEKTEAHMFTELGKKMHAAGKNGVQCGCVRVCVRVLRACVSVGGCKLLVCLHTNPALQSALPFGCSELTLTMYAQTNAHTCAHSPFLPQTPRLFGTLAYPLQNVCIQACSTRGWCTRAT